MASSDFPTTQWTTLLSAQGPEKLSIIIKKARENLCLRYWRPLFTYARMRGQSFENAEDLVQGFLARILDGDRYLTARPKDGRFRSYLLTAFQRYIINEWQKEGAAKRGGHEIVDTADFESAEKSVSGGSVGDSPEEAFDKAWAKTIISESMKTLEEKWGKGERQTLFEALKPHLTQETEDSLQEIAERLGRKPGTVRMSLNRLREDYRTIIRETVAATLAPGTDIDDEIQYLIGLLTSR